MKIRRIILLLCATLLSVGCITSCGVLQQKGNCFGPPTQSQVDQQAAIIAKLTPGS